MITELPQDTAILSRLFDVASEGMSRDLAAFLLTLNFDSKDQDRMQELMQKARDGDISQVEQDEFDSFERVGHVLGILQAKARVRLNESSQGL